jgi:hypothetical protein
MMICVTLYQQLGKRTTQCSAKNLRIDLTLRHLARTFAEQRRCCAITGVKFNRDPYEKAFVKLPLAPSVHRIDNSDGYTRRNVLLVCAASNFAQNQWSDDVLRCVAHGVVDKERKLKCNWFAQQERKLAEVQRDLRSTTPEQFFATSRL